MALQVRICAQAHVTVAKMIYLKPINVAKLTFREDLAVFSCLVASFATNLTFNPLLFFLFLPRVSEITR